MQSDKILIKKIEKLVLLHDIDYKNNDLSYLKTKYQFKESIYEDILTKKPLRIFKSIYKEWEENKNKAEEDYINSFNNYYDTLMNYSKEIEGNLEIIFDNN